MIARGSLDVLGLPEVLQMVSAQSKTGILTVQGTEDIVAISFLDGRIVAADALNQTVEEGLGRILTERGWVDRDEIKTLARAADHGDGRLIDLLVSRGAISRERLLEALRVQTFQLLLALLDWNVGEFKFYGGDEVSYEEGFDPIRVDDVLLRGAEEASLRAAHALPAPGSHLGRTALQPEIVVRPLGEPVPDPSEPSPDGSDRVWLSPEETAVLQAVNPERPVSAVAEIAGLTVERTRYLAYQLIERGLVEETARPQGFERPLERPVAAPSAAPPRPARSDALAEPPTTLAAPEIARPSPSVRSPGAHRAPLDDPAPTAPRRPRVVLDGRLETVVASVLGAVACAAVVLGLLFSPGTWLVPQPWLDAERSSLVDTQRRAALTELHRAADLHFLIEGRYPSDLDRLVDQGYLASGAANLPGEVRAAFTADETGTSVELPADADAGTARWTIDGDFLLDPEFAQLVDPSAARPPLVLLD
jgi:hypothetical protein